jgi:hypothetical protein
MSETHFRGVATLGTRRDASSTLPLARTFRKAAAAAPTLEFGTLINNTNPPGLRVIYDWTPRATETATGSFSPERDLLGRVNGKALVAAAR